MNQWLIKYVLLTFYVGCIFRSGIFGYLWGYPVFKLITIANLIFFCALVLFQVFPPFRKLCLLLKTSGEVALETSFSGIVATAKQRAYDYQHLIVHYIFPGMCLLSLGLILSAMFRGHLSVFGMAILLITTVLAVVLYPSLRSDHGLVIGQKKVGIPDYAILLAIVSTIVVLTSSFYFIQDRAWLRFYSLLFGTIIFFLVMRSYGYNFSSIKSGLYFWILSGGTILALLSGMWVTLDAWMDDHLIEKVVYEEKIIYANDPADISGDGEYVDDGELIGEEGNLEDDSLVADSEFELAQEDPESDVTDFIEQESDQFGNGIGEQEGVSPEEEEGGDEDDDDAEIEIMGEDISGDEGNLNQNPTTSNSALSILDDFSEPFVGSVSQKTIAEIVIDETETTLENCSSGCVYLGTCIFVPAFATCDPDENIPWSCTPGYIQEQGRCIESA